MKQIIIKSNKQGNKIASVDDEDYNELSKYNWTLTNKMYAARQLPRLGYNPKQVKVFMHHIIMGVPEKPFVIDHIDGNGLNNQKTNLRICLHQQNCCNSPSRKNTSSIYKGVRFDKTRNKWAAQITFNGNKINLGRYPTEAEAAKVYNENAVIYHKNFARLNNIQS